MKIFGVILLAVGILMIVITGFTVVTKKKVADVGPVEISKHEKTPIYWSPIAGAVVASAGIIVLLFARKKT